MSHALLLFSLAAAVLTITPGLDTALVLRTAINEGRRTAWLAGIGICGGVLLWGLLVAVGLGALLAASETAYTALRIGGALWLLWLGWQLLLGRASSLGEPDAQHTTASGWQWLWRGVLTNLLNPKVGLFYVTFLPQFIAPGEDVLTLSVLMALIHALMGALWFGVLVLVAARAGAWLRSPRLQRQLDRLLGLAFIGFGLRLALNR